MKLRSKVNLALSGVFLIGVGVTSVGAYTILIDDAIDSSAREARIVIEQASAIRTYTAESIKPLLVDRL